MDNEWEFCEKTNIENEKITMTIYFNSNALAAEYKKK